MRKTSDNVSRLLKTAEGYHIVFVTDEPSECWVTGLSLDADGLTHDCQVSALSPSASRPDGLPDSQMGGLRHGWGTPDPGQLAVVGLRHDWAMSVLEGLAAVWWTAQTSGC